MAHLPFLISDLAVLLITAGIITIVFKRLKQPVVLGYIVAGFLASNNFREIIKNAFSSLTNSNEKVLSFISSLPEISDITNVKTWAEIGVIFLLFALGLEFSFKKLMAVGRTAFLATFINSTMMIVIGYTVGKLLGWASMDCIFLGAMLSMSSTIIIIKAFSDMELQKKKFAGIVFGMLIVEDLLAILLLVMLTTLGVSRQFEGSELLYSIMKLVFFILIWFLVGIYLIPTILKKLKMFLNDETLLIVSIGLCLSMVLFATKLGFSAALGAFIMGSILAETVESKHIESLMEPLKNLFGAVFFVSVGMMIDPSVIANNLFLILILSLVVIVGRSTFATLGVVASGEGLKVAMQAGYSMTQIGEFSFIIATLGVSMGVISESLYPIIVAVSVITTFTTPYCIKAAIPVYSRIEQRIPSKFSKIIEGYATSSYEDIASSSNWRRLLKSMVSIFLIYFTICIAIMLLGKHLVIPFIKDIFPNLGGSILADLILVVALAPFLRAIMMRKNRSEEFKALWETNRLNKYFLAGTIVFRIFVSAILLGITIHWAIPSLSYLLAFLIGLCFSVAIIFSKGFKKQSRKIEQHFIKNLNQKQRLAEQKAAVTSQTTRSLLLKDIHIEEIEVPQTSSIVGKTLGELNFRQQTGVSIIAIIRGSIKNNIPDSKDIIFPFDKLVVAGSDEEIQNLLLFVDDSNKQIEENKHYHVELLQYKIEGGSTMVGKTVQELNLQRKTECLIVVIDRGDQTITTITRDIKIEENDILLLAGEQEKLETFEQNALL